MHYLIDKNIIWGIILILVLTFLFGMLINLKNAYAYTDDFSNLLNCSDDSDVIQDIKSGMLNRKINLKESSYIYISTSSGHRYYSLSGSFQYDRSYNFTGVEGSIDLANDNIDIPNELKIKLGIETICFNDISNTISIKNESLMNKTLNIKHPDYNYTTSPLIDGLIIELYNDTDTLIEVITPENYTDYTNILIPGNGTYYVKIKDSTIYNPYIITPQSNLTFFLPTLNLVPGQPYKIESYSETRYLEFGAEQPSQVYIYREYIDGTLFKYILC